jgi:hypothetical protein
MFSLITKCLRKEFVNQLKSNFQINNNLSQLSKRKQI